MNMKKYFKSYLDAVSDIEGKSFSQLVIIRDELYIKIKFLQHERLIHLLVTMLMAILLFISVAAYILDGGLILLPLIILLLCLVIPYIMHYYFLENTCQKLYAIYDEICRKTKVASDES